MATQAKTFRGSWRIVHMDTWDNDYPDLIEIVEIDQPGMREPATVTACGFRPLLRISSRDLNI